MTVDNYNFDQSNSLKEQISIIILSLINVVFSIKYGARVTGYYLLISLVIGLFTYLFLRYGYDFFSKISSKKLLCASIVLLSIFIVGSAILFLDHPVEKLNVDRWSVITSFWETVGSGEYAFYAKSNVGNYAGPMPFYFIIAYPFYLIGELGYFSILGLITFLLLVFFTSSKEQNKRSLFYVLFFLIISPFFLLEIISRSNLLLNSTLIIVVLYYFLEIKDNVVTTKRIVTSGVLLGLFLSTRNVYVLVYIIAFIYALRLKVYSLKQLTIVGLIALATFVITFLPFVIGHFKDFTQMNPFIVEGTALLPFHYTVGFAMLAFSLAVFTKDNLDVLFNSGLVLFISIVIYVIHNISINGLQTAIFESKTDISYFIFCIPFFLFFHIKQKKLND